MSLVVTGASGHLGRRVAELLLDGGTPPAELVLVTRSPDRLADLAARGAQVRAGDFDDPASLAAAFAGGSRLLLISTDGAMGARTAQHAAAIDAARDAGIGFVAYTSVVNASPGSPAVAAADHVATEAALRASGLRWALLRNALYAEYQVPGAAGALASGALVTNTGDGRSSYVSRDDCAAAAAAVLAGPGHEDAVYEITGPEAIDAAGLARRYAAVGGREVHVVQVDDAALTAGLVEQAGLPAPIAQVLATFGAAIREGFHDVVSDDVERLTGRAPATLASVLEASRSALVPA